MNLGSKINNLKTMLDAGLPVPHFTAIPFSLLVPDVSPLYEMMDEVRDLPLGDQSRRLRQAVRDLISPTFSLPVGDGQYAVRSSCSLEDSADRSFAGQFETFLNVSASEVPERIKDCVCSLFCENVLAYLRRDKADMHALEMNVLLQKMVRSELSGVLFTANPKGVLNESVIIVGRGLGENVVSDKIETTAYYYNTTDRVYYFDGKEELLDRAAVEKLITLSERICDLFGPYMDIEFAIENGEIYILQARPITTLSDDRPLILDNSNIVESYPGLSLPLTVSFVHSVYAGVFESAGRRLVKNKKILESLRPVFGDTVGSVNGRIYYKISNWYEIICCLPFRKKFLPIWQEMVGVRYKESFTPRVRISPRVRAGVAVNTVRELLKIPRSMEKLHKTFLEINAEATRRLQKDMTASEIFELYDLIETRILSDWGLTLLNDTYAFLFTGLLKGRMRKKHSGDDARANAVISGITNIESLRPIREMIRLACDRAVLTDDEYAKRKRAYISEFGDRSLEELKLESETFRTDPSLLDRKIEEYTADPEKLCQMAESLHTDVPEKEHDMLTEFLRRRATTGIMHREKSRLNRSRIFGLVREAVLRLGDLYRGQGLINDRRDVFYLTLDELRSLAGSPQKMQDVVEKRKKQYDTFALLPAYSRIVFAGEPFDKNPQSVNLSAVERDKDEMVGVPCSDGVVEGEAYVVQDVREVRNVRDKILITRMTDPGWVFLLAAAKGVVSEKGSLLSHTAIISRELGIPAVVGIDGLMKNVRTGDVVRLDGQSGTVRIVKRSAKK
ncbi:MAG: phosphoenolpyruvate synthase [Clostridiales bacterium]|nr:phosphoenolpyruvate synthase [Clostridiales bacterium]